MTARRHLALLAAVALGCSDSTAPFRLDGKWTRDYSVAGNSLVFTLATSAGVVSGSGRWTGDACCDGTVAVSGQTTGERIELDFSFTRSDGRAAPSAYHFTGRLISPVTLVGTITMSGGQTMAYNYRKLP